MKHDINELYRVVGLRGTFSKEAIEKANIEIVGYTNRPKEGTARRIPYMVHGKEPIRIYNNIERTKWTFGYFYGEHTWFDSQEELDNHRKEVNIEAKKNRIIKAKEEYEKARVNYEKAKVTWRLIYTEEN